MHRLNARQLLILVSNLKSRFNGILGGRPNAVGGIAFTPNTDDFHQTPALTTADALLNEGTAAEADDSKAMDKLRRQHAERVGRMGDWDEILRRLQVRRDGGLYDLRIGKDSL